MTLQTRIAENVECYMKALNGKNKPRPDPRGREAQRNGLLAKVHIAKKDIDVSDYAYEEILDCQFGVLSAAQLTIGELEELVRYFEQRGWTGNSHRRAKAAMATERGSATGYGRRRMAKSAQVEALRERIMQIAWGLENGEKRLQGLLEKICEVERLEWCWDVARLKQLLATFKKIAEKD